MTMTNVYPKLLGIQRYPSTAIAVHVYLLYLHRLKEINIPRNVHRVHVANMHEQRTKRVERAHKKAFKTLSAIAYFLDT